VEVCYKNNWSPICTAGFDHPDAAVVCRQLGFVGTGEGYVGIGEGYVGIGEGYVGIGERSIVE
jgi:hypothetical protein